MGGVAWRGYSLLVVGLLAGCAAGGSNIRDGVHDKYPDEFVFVEGGGPKQWYSGKELEQIARRYAEDKHLGFDFEGTDRSVWVHTADTSKLATVSFSSAMGRQALIVYIGRRGAVIGHHLGVAVCGAGG